MGTTTNDVSAESATIASICLPLKGIGPHKIGRLDCRDVLTLQPERIPSRLENLDPYAFFLTSCFDPVVTGSPNAI